MLGVESWVGEKCVEKERKYLAGYNLKSKQKSHNTPAVYSIMRDKLRGYRVIFGYIRQ